MAVTFPQNLPSWLKGMSRCEFTLPKELEVVPVGDGGDIARDLGPDLWAVDFRTARLTSDQVEDFAAWLKLQENGLQTFYAYNYRRPFTKASPNGFSGLTRAGGGAFTGAVTLTTVNSDNKTLTLGGLPASYTINPGDAIAWDYGGTIRAYHHFVEAATSTSLGAIAAIEVRPLVRPGWTAGQTANIGQAMAKLRLVPNSAQLDAQDRGPGYYSFKATQTLQA